LTENPQLQQKESILRADKIKIFLNENRSQAEGDVRVTFVNTKDGAPGLAPVANAAATPVPQQGAPTPAAAVTPQAAATVTTTSTKTSAVTPTPTPTKKKQPKKTPTPKPKPKKK